MTSVTSPMTEPFAVVDAARERSGSGTDTLGGAVFDAALAGHRHRLVRTHGAVLPLEAGTGAWSGGQLVVSGWPPGGVIDELSRYRPGHLVCDPAVAGLRVSGAFQLGDTDRVLDNLSGTLPVRINRFTRYWATVEPA